MTRRIEERIALLRSRGRTGLAAYLVAGDPDPGASLAALRALVSEGASLLEIGMPFSDPVADGPVVAAGHRRALRAGQTTRGVFDLVARFRADDPTTPVVLMGYVNPALNLGVEGFFEEASRCGADGAILVDLPLEHASPWRSAAERHGVALVPLWAPTAPPERERRILSHAPGLAYMVARTGVTGAGAFDVEAVRERARRARRDHGIALAAGFGIGEPGQARSLAGAVDLVVAGSCFVEILAGEGGDPIGELRRRARGFVDALGGA